MDLDKEEHRARSYGLPFFLIGTFMLVNSLGDGVSGIRIEILGISLLLGGMGLLGMLKPEFGKVLYEFLDRQSRNTEKYESNNSQQAIAKGDNNYIEINKQKENFEDKWKNDLIPEINKLDRLERTRIENSRNNDFKNYQRLKGRLPRSSLRDLHDQAIGDQEKFKEDIRILSDEIEGLQNKIPSTPEMNEEITKEIDNYFKEKISPVKQKIKNNLEVSE